MNLYELTIEGMEMERALVESEGVLSEDLERRFDEILTSGKDKMVAACHVRQNMIAEAEACRIEAQRLWARQKAKEREIESLNARILAAVDAAYSGKLKTATFTIWGQTSGATEEISLAADVDIKQLAEETTGLVRVTYEVDKAGCKAFLKENGPVPEIISTPKAGTRFLRVK